MKNRAVVALCAALALAAPAFAQTSAEGLSAPTAVTVEKTVLPPDTFCPESGGCAVAEGQFWVTGDYLLAWIRGENIQSLVTTSPAGTPRATAGIFGAPTTQFLFTETANDDLRSGFRLGAGYWFTPERILGVEAGFAMLESQATFYAVSSDGNTILARPFVNALTGNQEAVLVAFPGSSSGSVEARASSGNFYSAHLDLTENIYDCGCLRLDSIVGYRFYRFDGGLRARQTITPTDPAFVPGTVLTATDDFNTQNEFHGGDLGLRARLAWNNLGLDLLGKIAVGSLHREVNISGNLVTTVPGAAPVVQTGGVYALASNIGTHGSDDWTFMPELGVNLSWRVNANVRMRLGYTALYLAQIARPSEQVDFTINPNLFPPPDFAPGQPLRPAFGVNRADVWIHGINLGLELTF